jgi:hypothetical protein
MFKTLKLGGQWIARSRGEGLRLCTSPGPPGSFPERGRDGGPWAATDIERPTASPESIGLVLDYLWRSRVITSLSHNCTLVRHDPDHILPVALFHFLVDDGVKH